MKIQYLNFHTEFSSEGPSTQTTIKMGSGPCFGRMIHKWTSGVTVNTVIKYDIVLYKGLKQAESNKWSNACFFSKKEIKDHLKFLNGVFIKARKPRTRVIEEEDKFHIHIKINGNKKQHKFCLTWIRYLYEFPFNMFLLDARQLKKSSNKYCFESVINLVNVVGTSYCRGYQVDQSLFDKGATFKTTEELKKSLSAYQSGKILNMWKYNNNAVTLLRRGELPKVEESQIDSTESWSSVNKLNSRIEIYNKVYDIFKDNK